ncbi:hypothetical protein SDC9_168790 [bioreactor metagenome]|uniref:Uncharacterized protein n=1 Tax=bioreactor metagenome TaxID=1076179 RepID=A0A645G3G8_9ZZZZ
MVGAVHAGDNHGVRFQLRDHLVEFMRLELGKGSNPEFLLEMLVPVIHADGVGVAEAYQFRHVLEVAAHCFQIHCAPTAGANLHKLLSLHFIHPFCIWPRIVIRASADYYSCQRWQFQMRFMKILRKLCG